MRLALRRGAKTVCDIDNDVYGCEAIDDIGNAAGYAMDDGEDEWFMTESHQKPTKILKRLREALKAMDE